MRTFPLIFGVYISILICSSCDISRTYLTKEEKKWIKENNHKIDVPFGYVAPPNAYYDEDSNYVGIFPDFKNEIEKKSGLHLKYKHFDTWNEILEYSKTNNNYVIVGIAESDERKEFIRYTNTLIKLPYIILTNKDSDISSVKDLVGKKVGIPKGYIVSEFIKNKYPWMNCIEFDEVVNGVRAVALRNCDAFIITQMYALYIIEEQGIANLKIAANFNFENRIPAGVSVNDEILFSIIDKTVDQIPIYKKKQIYNRYMYSTNRIVTKRVIIIWSVVLSATIIILTFLWLWSFTLKSKVQLRTRELSIAKEKAEEASRLKSEFLNNMSHEVRTPMNGIVGFSELLESNDITEEKRIFYSKIIQNSGYQLLKIIDNILEMSILDTKQESVYEEVFDLNEMLLELHSIFNLRIKGHAINLNLIIPDEKLGNCFVCDKTKLNKIISNLLENALKFTEKGHIDLGYMKRDDNLVIFVKDTGIGISPKYKELIFERFAQVEKDISQKKGGLGLGLSISRESARLMNGDLTFESEKGKGTTFYVTLPFKKSLEQKKEEGQHKPTNRITSDKNLIILVAEDEDINYAYIETIIEEDPFIEATILRAANGKEAVDFCKTLSNLDLVFMDIKMPVLNGLDATKEIKKIRPDLPIIAQTAYSMKQDKILALDSGCNDFISKPINKKQFFKLIDQYVN